MLNVLSLIAYKWQHFIPTGNRMNGTCLELLPSTRHRASSGACDGESDPALWELTVKWRRKTAIKEFHNMTWNRCVKVITYCILLTQQEDLTCHLESSTGMPHSYLRLVRYRWNSLFPPNMSLLPCFLSQGLDNTIHPAAQDLDTCLSSHRANHIYLLNISNLYVSLHLQQQFLSLAITFFHGDYSNRHWTDILNWIQGSSLNRSLTSRANFHKPKCDGMCNSQVITSVLG